MGRVQVILISSLLLRNTIKISFYLVRSFLFRRIPFCQQQLYRRLYDRIPSFLDILARNGNRNVRIDSELRMLFVHIQDRQAEKRTLHPFGNSELKGKRLPPPVRSPMTVTCGRRRITLTKSFVAL